MQNTNEYIIEQFKEHKAKAADIFEIRQIDKPIAYRFVSKYHYLGRAKFFAKFSFGLICGTELVGVATYAYPQGSEALHGWFGLPNSEKKILELTRLCMLPSLNGTNATSFLLGGSMKELKREGVRAIITLAAADRHNGAIYQVCNFKYYGLTSPKCDFWAFETQSKPRGVVRDLQGVWVKKPQKHRYAYIFDKSLKCLYSEQPKPPKGVVAYSCCDGTQIVHDNRYDVNYTCPICTGHLWQIKNGKIVKPPQEENEQIYF